jgi:acetate kinase
VSVAAIQNGKSIDTSMGFTPLEGSVMGTRSGDIDAGIVTYLQKKRNMSAAEVNNFLNKDCGLFGISGVSSDMRDLWAKYEKEGNQRAKLAIDIFIYRIAKYIGSYAVAMKGLDMVVYTGGIGENDWNVRLGISEYLGFLGAEIDRSVNDHLRTDKIISTPGSKIKLALVETNEELVIALDTVNIITKKVS